MADRTALTAGIAAASIAAVVAATPALITAPNNDVQVSAAAADLAKRTVSVNVQLAAAFSLQGLLTAFAEGYEDGTYNGDVFGDQASQAGVEGAIYYALDTLLPEAFDYDDHAFAVYDSDAGFDLSNVYYHLAVDLGVDEDLAFAFVAFLSDPLNTSLILADAPDLLIDLINDPITTAINTVAGEELGEVINHFINNPITDTINLVGGDLGPLVNQFINFPVQTVQALAVAAGVPVNVVRLITEPVVAGFDVLEDLGLPEEVGNFVADPTIETAKLLAAVLGLTGIPGVSDGATTLGLKSGSEETVGITSTETKAPKLVKLDLPTPAEAVSQIKTNVDSAVKDFTAAITPKKLDKVKVQTLVDDKDTEDKVTDDKDTEDKGKLKLSFDGPGAKLAKGVSDSLKAASDKHAEKRADRVANFKKKHGGSEGSDGGA